MGDSKHLELSIDRKVFENDFLSTLSEDLNQAAAAAITFIGTTQPTPITAKLVKDFYNQNNGCSSSFENLDLCTTLQVVDHSLVCTTYNCYSGSPSVASCSARMGCGNAFCDDV